MKEQFIVGILALSLAVGFIFSIEVLAHRDRPQSEDDSVSCLAHFKFYKMHPKKCSDVENCVDYQKMESSMAKHKTKICMAGYN